MAGWIELPDDYATKLIDKTLELYRSRVDGVHSYPEPYRSSLELAYLLYITNKITDLSPLKELASDHSVLQFLINSESFDYSKVDFTNYMWQNIAKQPRFMDRFIEHKDTIIPMLKKKILLDVASEFEKKVLYGCLLDRELLFR